MSLLSRFSQDRSGATAVMFALMLVPLIGSIGLVVDYSRAFNSRTRVQAALDSAALVAGMDRATHSDDEYRRIATATFETNLGGIGAQLRSLDVTQSSTEVVFSATASVPTSFAAALGFRSIDLAFRSAVNKRTQKKIDFQLLLDNSASMGLAATPAGRDQLIALRGCAFACHLPEGGQRTSNLEVARQAGILTRVDVLRTSVMSLLNRMQSASHDAYAMRVSIDSFDDNPLQRVALTDRIDQAVSYISAFDLGNNTNFSNAMPLYQAHVMMAKPADVKTYALIVTDGVQGRRDRSTGFHPFDSSLCDSLKRKATVLVLNTKYVPMPTQQPYRETVQPIQNQLAPALQACASPGFYFEATDQSEIESAFNRIFNSMLADLALTR